MFGTIQASVTGYRAGRKVLVQFQRVVLAPGRFADLTLHVEQAMRPGHQLVARIRLTGTAAERGVTWSAEAAHGQQGTG